VTKGAVVAEMIGRDRMKSALIYPDRKLIHDYRSGMFEIYQSDTDPRELQDLYGTDPSSSALLRYFAGYHAIREANRSYRFIPDKPSPELSQ
jgi:hypothetical protein